MARRHEDGLSLTVPSDASLATACSRLRDTGGGPVPVLRDDDIVIGVIDATTALQAVRAGRSNATCADIAFRGTEIDAHAARTDLEEAISRNGHAMITDRGKLVGIVDALDLLRNAERGIAEETDDRT